MHSPCCSGRIRLLVLGLFSHAKDSRFLTLSFSTCFNMFPLLFLQYAQLAGNLVVTLSSPRWRTARNTLPSSSRRLVCLLCYWENLFKCERVFDTESSAPASRGAHSVELSCKSLPQVVHRTSLNVSLDREFDVHASNKCIDQNFILCKLFIVYLSHWGSRWITQSESITITRMRFSVNSDRGWEL